MGKRAGDHEASSDSESSIDEADQSSSHYDSDECEFDPDNLRAVRIIAKQLLDMGAHAHRVTTFRKWYKLDVTVDGRTFSPEECKSVYVAAVRKSVMPKYLSLDTSLITVMAYLNHTDIAVSLVPGGPEFQYWWKVFGYTPYNLYVGNVAFDGSSVNEVAGRSAFCTVWKEEKTDWEVFACGVRQLAKEHLIRLIDKHPELKMYMTPLLNKRFGAADKRLADLQKKLGGPCTAFDAYKKDKQHKYADKNYPTEKLDKKLRKKFSKLNEEGVAYYEQEAQQMSTERDGFDAIYKRMYKKFCKARGVLSAFEYEDSVNHTSIMIKKNVHLKSKSPAPKRKKSSV